MKRTHTAYISALIAAAFAVEAHAGALPTHTIGIQIRPNVVDCTQPNSRCITPPPPTKPAQ